MEAATTTAPRRGEPLRRPRASPRPAPPGPAPDRDLVAPGPSPAVCLPRAIRRHVLAPHRPRRDLGDALRSGGGQAGLHRRPARLPRRRGEPDPRAGARPELGPRPRREAPHQPAPPAAAAVPRRADAGLSRDDGRDRRARDRELADRRPVPVAAADAGDHARRHPQHRLRRRRGGAHGGAAGRAAQLPRPDDQSPRPDAGPPARAPPGRRGWAGSAAGSRPSIG